MSDHYHHASEVQGAAEERHSHPDLEREIGMRAEERHRHYDDERAVEELRGQVRELRAIMIEFGLDLSEAQGRIHALEASTPEARQAELEADIARADAAGTEDDVPDCQAISDAGTWCTGHDWHALPHRDVSGYEWGEDA